MKTRILAGILISGVLATSAAQATISQTDEIYSGMSAAAIQKDQQANPAAARHSVRTCAWHEAENNVVDSLYAAYPGSEANFGEKDYFASANQDFVC